MIEVKERYIYKGEYTEFRGYVFKWGKATTVTDRGTVEALRKRSDFLRIHDENDAEEHAAQGNAAQGHAERNATEKNADERIGYENGHDGQNDRGPLSKTQRSLKKPARDWRV